jgi:hypothetical protein
LGPKFSESIYEKVHRCISKRTGGAMSGVDKETRKLCELDKFRDAEKY